MMMFFLFGFKHYRFKKNKNYIIDILRSFLPYVRAALKNHKEEKIFMYFTRQKMEFESILRL